MKLYEINQQLMELFDKLIFDPETGEIGDNFDEIYAEIDQLQMEKTSILQYLAKEVLNLRGNQEELKNEEDRLKKRREILSKREDRILKILDRECAGKKADLGIAVFTYRTSHQLSVFDKSATITWLKENGKPDGIRVAEPEVNKEYVKKLIKAGEKVPGAEITDNISYTLK